jgi:hypothetical protein
MKELNKAARQQHQACIDDLGAAGDALVKARAVLAEEFSDAWAVFAIQVQQYNDALVKARSHRDVVMQAMDEYVHERSDAWMESDAQVEMEEWRNAWDDAGLDDIDLDMPEMPELEDELIHRQELRDLPLKSE